MSDTDDTRGVTADRLHDALAHITTWVQEVEDSDPDEAAHGLMDETLADSVANVQDIRRRLLDAERALAGALGKRVGQTTGSLADGRQFTLKRATDRKEWDHEEWQRDARRKVVEAAMADRPLVVMDTSTGEEMGLGMLLHGVLATAQQLHGSTAPRSRELKKLGLFAGDYSTSTPNGWTFSAVAPTATQGGATSDG